MANWLLPNGAEGLADGTLDFDTDPMKVALLDLNVTDTAVKTITSSTNATPIVVTCTAHGFANGDYVIVRNVATGTAANNIWRIKNQATNTFELASVIDGTTNSVGNGVGSGGIAICLGPSAAGDNWDDYNACLVGSLVSLASLTAADGLLSAANPTFTSVAGTTTIEAVACLEDTGTPSTSRVLTIMDGYHVVICNTTAASSATSISVEPLEQAIANGASAVFSNGAVATLSGSAAIGARSISVSALAAQITAGSYASYLVSGQTDPLVTSNGGNIGLTLDAVYGIAKIRRY